MPNCKYKEACFFSHEIKNDNEYQCFECGEKFVGIRFLMTHRREKHTIQDCKKYLEGTCTYNEKSCWFKHISRDGEQSQDFQIASQQIKQPIELLLDQNKQMIANMSELINQVKIAISQQ